MMRAKMKEEDDDRRELEILENVKRRMDRNLKIRNEQTSSSSSYCGCSNHHHSNRKIMSLDYNSESCDEEKKIGSSHQQPLMIDKYENQSSLAKNKVGTTKREKRILTSSPSVDSGVLVDVQSGKSVNININWQSTEDDIKSNDDDDNDDILCHRVENAVRKFTEKLIVYERRAKERSKRRITSKNIHSSTNSLFDCLRNLKNFNYEDEERITDISTPSLVSLSDTDVESD